MVGQSPACAVCYACRMHSHDSCDALTGMGECDCPVCRKREADRDEGDAMRAAVDTYIPLDDNSMYEPEYVAWSADETAHWEPYR
jgi:hypothetical protein